MKPSLAGLIAAAVVALASCSAPKTPDTAALEARASARILAIPPAAPEKYRGMTDMKGWRNPYLILRADGVALLDPENHLERILKPGELTRRWAISRHRRGLTGAWSPSPRAACAAALRRTM